jgi:hypothetical protein
MISVAIGLKNFSAPIADLDVHFPSKMALISDLDAVVIAARHRSILACNCARVGRVLSMGTGFVARLQTIARRPALVRRFSPESTIKPLRISQLIVALAD